ncbi:MAG TPA: GTPase HflX [Rhizomicrobium sp.]|nr:GTPase HflX [Rhizomicrobium sp.]
MKKSHNDKTKRRAAFVVHVEPKTRGRSDEYLGRDAEARLAECVGLTAAIGLDVVSEWIVPLAQPKPATLIGTGKVEEIASDVHAREPEVVVVNAQLSPVQQRNLEKAWGAKVLDRTALILEIFGERAQTREGRLQVELAHLTYQRSRLVRSWTHLERQRGGFGFLGGPGETQIETDRRLIGERISRIKKELSQVTRTRGLHREARRRVPYPIVALVGYTNAGKSTLFNRLTKADVLAKDLLFATLDPTMRGLTLPDGRKVILSDTVGFIADLPIELVAAFRATLEEVLEADVILHVRDAAHGETEAQKKDVLKVLNELGVEPGDDRPLIEVLNKIDLLEPGQREGLLEKNRAHGKGPIAISAMTGEGLDDLLARLQSCFAQSQVTIELALDPADGAGLAWAHAHGHVLNRRDGTSALRLTVAVDRQNLDRFLNHFGSSAIAENTARAAQ